MMRTDGAERSRQVKVCFIIMAHHQPKVFHKLLRQLCWPNSDIVVHIDKRSDLEDFEIPGKNNVHFLKSRNKVHWAGWSQTRTMCELLKAGLRLSDADYFLFLAGTDFPIKNRSHINDFLSNHYPANFLNYYPLVPGIWGYGHIEKFFLVDLRAAVNDVRYGGPRSDKSRFKRFLMKMIGKTEAMLNGRLLPRNTRWTHFYSGSSRWCLNRETTKFVVKYFYSLKSQRLKNYLRLTKSSDEVFFQTAILNSEHKKHCLGFDEKAALEIFAGERPPMPDEKRVYMHYIDWSPEREDPAILVESDLEALEKSDKLFAVKFTDEKSLGLLEKLERRLTTTAD